MKLQVYNDFKNRRPPPPILYRTNHAIIKTPIDKVGSFKVKINTKYGEKDSETVAIYVPLCRTGSPEALLKFVKILHKIIKGQDLSMGPHKYGMINQFSPPKAIQDQKRYLHRGLCKPHDTKICKLICSIDDILNYLEKFPPFGTNQDLPEDDILKPTEFFLP